MAGERRRRCGGRNAAQLSFGEIMRLTKNAAGSSDNKRSFTLIGDPALKLAMPRLKIMTDSINGLDPSIEMDTIRALSKVTIKGHVEDQSGMVLNGFNGILAPSVFDKTFANAPEERTNFPPSPGNFSIL